MAARLRARWLDLVDGFWFVPAAVALAYVFLALGLIAIDRSGGDGGVDAAFGGDAEAARGILSTIAGSLITVAGLTFSLTIVVLTLVSSQFSTRVVRNLLADRVNQIVAGSFTGLFAFCLIVLRTVRDPQPPEPEFVPALSVSVSIVLALFSLALLLVFIHHMGTSIQAPQIAARVGRATLAAIEQLYPEPYGHAVETKGEALVEEWEADGAPRLVFPKRAGYVREIVLDDIAEHLGEVGAHAHVRVCPGDFVTENQAILAVWPTNDLPEDAVEPLRRACHVAKARDLRQDAAYGIRQLADVALKALSPGINDPTTAATCVSYLRAVLEEIAGRASPSDVRLDPESGIALVVRRFTFDELVSDAFDEVARYSADNARVTVAVLDALAGVAGVAVRAQAYERTTVILQVGRAAAEAALTEARTERDQAAVQRALERLEGVAGGTAPAPGGKGEMFPPAQGGGRATY